MEFDLASIRHDFDAASGTEYGTIDDNSNLVLLGPRLNYAVRDMAKGYLQHLELGPENKATDERAKLLDLHWGRIEHDGAKVRGLGAAMTGFADVLATNVGRLQESWKGESYDAFKAAIDKVQAVLTDYGEKATITGEGVVNAMSQVRELYQTFADDSADKHLNFDGYSPPAEWHKVDDPEADESDKNVYSGATLALFCPFDHGLGCAKAGDEPLNLITGRFVSQRRWGICKDDPCYKNPARVNIMYANMVDECQAAVDRIKGKLDNYYGAVKTTVDGVSNLYDAALGNVFKLAEPRVLSQIRVIGGQPAGGGPPAGGDTTGYPSGGGGGPVDSGYPGGGMDAGMGPAAVAEPMPPEPAPADTVAQEPPPVAETPAEQAGTVEIKDGDRTIGVSSPDSEGRVRVTVQDATGATKTYELDFAAASGLPADQPTGAVPGPDGVVPEQIAARTDGTCVIQDGPLTITAERPLFSPDSIELVVDDGSGNPATYTLDFEAQDPPPATGAEQPAQGTVDAGSPAGQPVDPAPAPAEGPGQGTADPTSPQAWQGDGSVSGVLVPDQPDGEAHLATAADAQPDVAGMAGAGLPIGGPAGGGSDAGGRAGSGWSVHGDLFDNAEPVYSMHGVLGDDEAAE